MTRGRRHRRVGPDVRYTRIVVGFRRAVTSLVLTTALAVSPALLSLCLVTCVPNAVAAAAPAERADVAPLSAEHSHHGRADASASVAGAAAAHETARVDGECHDCCAGAATALDAGVAGERPSAMASMMSPAAGLAAPSVVMAAPATRRGPLPASPPAPVRAPLVLRI